MGELTNYLAGNRYKRGNLSQSLMDQYLDPNIIKRGSLLPMGRNAQGGIEPAIPQFLIDALETASYPGQALQGKQLPPNAGTDLALNLMGGGAATGLLAKPQAGVFGMNVWHGGPNGWLPEPGYPKGRPRLDKVGTGEGAQAYGHGFYAAESRAVGADYKNRLSQLDDIGITKALPEKYHGNTDARNRILDDIHKAVLDGDIKKGSDYLTVYDVAPGTEEAYKIAGKAYDNQGHLKHLDIPDEDIARYMDWDAPLSEQPENVRKALIDSGIAREWNLVDRYGKTAYYPGQGFATEAEAMAAAKDFGMTKNYGPMYKPVREDPTIQDIMKGFDGHKTPKEASEALRKAGIPGLKYYDGMSRGKGKGTRNYVTWDQDVLNRTKILDE